MLKKITLVLALTGAVSLPAMAHSEHCKDTELGNIMKTMKTDLKLYVEAFKADDKGAMQAQAAKLLTSARQAKNEVPLKLQQDPHGNMADMSHAMDNMPAMDHDMGNMKGMPAMKHDMAAMDHRKMGNMAGMDHQTHMQHMAYTQGIEKLSNLFEQLQTATDRAMIKATLGQIKQHSKTSHREFRLDCK